MNKVSTANDRNSILIEKEVKFLCDIHLKIIEIGSTNVYQEIVCVLKHITLMCLFWPILSTKVVKAFLGP